VLTKNPMTSVERRAVGALALLYSFRMLGLFMVLPVLALYAADMEGASPLMIGLALGAYGFSQAFLQIPLGWLSDRIGRRPVILGGLAVFALGSAVAAQADSVGWIVVGRLLQGAGAIAGTVMALVADVTNEEQRTKAMAIVGASIGLSFALSMVLGPLLAGIVGLQGVFAVTTALALSGMLIIVLMLPRHIQQQRHAEVGARAGLIGSVLRDPVLRRFNFGIFSLHFILTASFLAIPAVIENGLGVERAEHWQVYLPVLVISILGMLPMLRRAERGGQVRAMLLTAIVMLLASIPAMLLAPVTILLYAPLCLYFIAVNYLEASLPSMVSKAVEPAGKGTALGVYSTCQFVGAFLGGSLGGVVLQQAGMTGLAVLCLVPGLVWLASSWRLGLQGPARTVSA
jgi:MFS family permease